MFDILSISPKSIKKIKDPNTLPYGAPDNTGIGFDFLPSTKVDWNLLVRIVLIHLYSFPLIPSLLLLFRATL